MFGREAAKYSEKPLLPFVPGDATLGTISNGESDTDKRNGTVQTSGATPLAGITMVAKETLEFAKSEVCTFLPREAASKDIIRLAVWRAKFAII